MSGALAYVILLAVVEGGLAGGGVGASVQQRFAAAQAQFEAAQAKLVAGDAGLLEARRMFREAGGGFAALAEEGNVSSNLFVNAGNAFHFAGDEPRALLWYVRAERLARTPEIRSGLATLRRVCGVDLWPPPRPSIGRVLMFWHYDLGSRLKQVLLLVFYPAGCALVIVGLLTRRRRLRLRMGLVFMLLGAAMGVSDAVAAPADGDQWGVVLAPTKGYGGDGPMYSVIVDAIRPGQEVRIVEARRDWVHVELPGGTRCWLAGESCEPVRLRSGTAGGAS